MDRIQRLIKISSIYERAMKLLIAERNPGAAVINAAAIDEGGAPLARTAAGSLVLPDLLVHAPNGSTFYVELKCKARAAWHRNREIFTTGFEVRQFENYLAFERKTGKRVYIVFVHDNENEIRFASCSEFAELVDHEGVCDGAPHFYVNFHDLRLMCSREDLLRHIPHEDAVCLADLGVPLSQEMFS